MAISPLLLDDYARHVLDDRLKQARHAALVAQARAAHARDARSAAARRSPLRPVAALATGARHVAADGLRGLATRIDPSLALVSPSWTSAVRIQPCEDARR